jgi:hypothetical protein
VNGLRRSRPGFVLDAANADGVRAVCEQLDGVPLAIELAAARLRSTGLADISNGVANRFALLDSTSHGVLPRHRTLAACVEWSGAVAERSLDEEGAELFCCPGRGAGLGVELGASDVGCRLRGGLPIRSTATTRDADVIVQTGRPGGTVDRCRGIEIGAAT